MVIVLTSMKRQHDSC